MKLRPLQNTPAYFHRILDGLLARNWPAKAEVAGLRVLAGEAQDPVPRIDANPRLSVMLAGRQRYSIAEGRSRREVVVRPGQCLYWPGGAWSIPHWEEPCLFFGVVFRSSSTRYLMVDFPGGPAPEIPTPWACHVTPALGGESRHLQRALEAHAGSGFGGPAAERFMVLALLHLAAAHLAGADGEAAAGSSLWQKVLDHLHARYADPQLSRASAAEALGVHPNYLSLLAKRQGSGFQDALEEIRLRHARHFLTRSGLPAGEVYRHCGYATPVYFQRVFRRKTGLSPADYARKFARLEEGADP